MLKSEGKNSLHLETPSRLFPSFFPLFRTDGVRTRAGRKNSQINYAVDED
jgi:hypothetical protein